MFLLPSGHTESSFPPSFLFILLMLINFIPVNCVLDWSIEVECVAEPSLPGLPVP